MDKNKKIFRFFFKNHNEGKKTIFLKNHLNPSKLLHLSNKKRILQKYWKWHKLLKKYISEWTLSTSRDYFYCILRFKLEYFVLFNRCCYQPIKWKFYLYKWRSPYQTGNLTISSLVTKTKCLSYIQDKHLKQQGNRASTKKIIHRFTCISAGIRTESLSLIRKARAVSPSDELPSPFSMHDNPDCTHDYLFCKRTNFYHH